MIVESPCVYNILLNSFSISRDHIELIVVKGELLFFKQRDGPYIPTLKLLHKCELLTFNMCSVYSIDKTADPDMLPKVQVDKGAIRFILSGANVMCPGLTSPGGRMDGHLPANTIVVSSSMCTSQGHMHLIDKQCENWASRW